LKLTGKTFRPLLLLIFLGTVIGTLAWGILERLISHLSARPFDLSVGPLGFDLGVLQFYIKINPGSLLGAAGGFFIFRSL
jgi:hypothetical protein